MPTAPRQAICATTTSTSRPTTCRLSAYTGYTYGLQKGYIALNYDFRYAKDTKDNPLYILDWPVNGDSTRFNLLPSTADALSQMMDKGNSYHYTQHKREHQVGLIFFRTLMPGSDLKALAAPALAQSESHLFPSATEQCKPLASALRA